MQSSLFVDANTDDSGINSDGIVDDHSHGRRWFSIANNDVHTDGQRSAATAASANL